jgi:hypothetical protein
MLAIAAQPCARAEPVDLIRQFRLERGLRWRSRHADGSEA